LFQVAEGVVHLLGETATGIDRGDAVAGVVGGLEGAHEGAVRVFGLLLGAVALEVVAVLDLVAEVVGDGAQVVGGVVVVRSTTLTP
jgi:hypothetical protein